MSAFRIFLAGWALLLASQGGRAADVDYWRTDSVKVVRLLEEAPGQKSGASLMLYFGRKLKGLPYVAKTLERNGEERLVVNLRQMDCTTLVETALALTRCAEQGKRGFGDFCHALRLIRYEGGEVGYARRLHYFTAWIQDNVAQGFVQDIQGPDPPFSAVQTVRANYMTSHVGRYPMLVGRPDRVRQVGEMERRVSGLKFRYIPKAGLADSKRLRETIHDGDIIAILTSKAGLDTSHIGIAVWHKDGLHLLNASSVHRKVVEEPMLLATYMARHPSQIGIRVVRPK